MRQSTFPFASDSGAEGRSLLKVLDQHRSGEDRAQRGFRQLVASIERRRNELAHWQDYAQRYDRRVAGEIKPLRRKLVDEQRHLALLIDELLTSRSHSMISMILMGWPTSCTLRKRPVAAAARDSAPASRAVPHAPAGDYLCEGFSFARHIERVPAPRLNLFRLQGTT